MAGGDLSWAMSGAREPRHIESLIGNGFAFVDSDAVDSMLGNVLTTPGWARFASSWNDLAIDAYLAEHGTYRRRRHAVFSVSKDGVAKREPHRPHYQSKNYNTLQIDDEHQQWPFRGEYWKDELGYYRFKVQNKCGR